MMFIDYFSEFICLEWEFLSEGSFRLIQIYMGRGGVLLELNYALFRRFVHYLPPLPGITWVRPGIFKSNDGQREREGWEVGGVSV